MQLRELGQCPINETSPAGTEPRQSADYERLLEETGKLSSLQGAAAVNWQTVVESAAAVLEQHAKDIPAAVYLCTGLAHTRGLPGLADGCRILADLLARWWDTCFPPLKRLRARLNMLVWWRERITPLLEAPQEAISPALRDDLLTSLRELDATLGEVLPDLPPLRDLMERVQRLEVTADAASPAVEAAPETPVEAEAVQTPPEPQPAPPLPEPTPSRSEPSATLSPLPADAGEALASYLAAARSCAALAFAEHLPEAPAAWSALYTALWGRIEKLPPAENLVTAIPAPQEEDFTACRNLLSAGRAAEAAAALARLLPACPFRLDGQHLLHKALTACGRTTEAALVQRESRALAERLPGVLDLHFADGQPFASAETRLWLQTTGTTTGTPETAGVTPADSLYERARTAASDGNLAAALDMLEDARRTAASTAQGFALRLEQARLLALAGHVQAAAPLAEELEQLMETHALNKWDPDLCLEALEVCHKIWSGMETPDARARTADIAAALCRLRPSHSPLLR